MSSRASSGAKKRYRVRRSGPLRGSVRVPGDKSIGHRSLIFGALGRGRPKKEPKPQEAKERDDSCMG